MSQSYKKRIRRRDLPEEFGPETIKTIARIEAHPSVAGILFVRRNIVNICTVPETMAQTMVTKLPNLTSAMRRALTEITVTINDVNPIIDRIMDDESVAGVVMTNKEGAPILTNISTTRATNYGLKLNRFGVMAQNYIKELDPLDEVLAVRFHTKKFEVMLAPHPEFNIIVIQHPMHKAAKQMKKENLHKTKSN